jgi:Zn ribbon nucleic-acid-binding protein
MQSMTKPDDIAKDLADTNLYVTGRCPNCHTLHDNEIFVAEGWFQVECQDCGFLTGKHRNALEAVLEWEAKSQNSYEGKAVTTPAGEGMEPISRYDFDYDTMEENHDGGTWVYYQDHAAQVEQLRLELLGLATQNKQLLEELHSDGKLRIKLRDRAEAANDRIAELETQLAQLNADRDAVLEVLKPLADIADGYSDFEPDDCEIFEDFDALGATFPLSRCRRARDLYRSLKGGQNG